MARPSDPAAIKSPPFGIVVETIRGKERYRIYKRTLLEVPTLNNPGGHVAGMGEVNCSGKAILFLRYGQRTDEKVMD